MRCFITGREEGREGGERGDCMAVMCRLSIGGGERESGYTLGRRKFH